MWGDLPPTPNRFPLQVGGGKERREQQRNEEVGCLQALPPAAVAKPGGWKGALGSLGEEFGALSLRWVTPRPPGAALGRLGRSLGRVVPLLGAGPPPPPGAGGCPPRQGRPWARCTDAGGTPRGCKVQQEITPPEEGGSRGAGSPFPARLLPTPRLGPWQPLAPSTSIRAPAPPGQCPDHSRIMADLSRRLAALMLLGAALCGEWTWDCLLAPQGVSIQVEVSGSPGFFKTWI